MSLALLFLRSLTAGRSRRKGFTGHRRTAMWYALSQAGWPQRAIGNLCAWYILLTPLSGSFKNCCARRARGRRLHIRQGTTTRLAGHTSASGVETQTP